LRKRSQLVHQRTANLHSVRNLLARNLGRSASANGIKRMSDAQVSQRLPDVDLALAVQSNLAVMRTLDKMIARLQRAVLTRVKLRPEFKQLLTVSGIGQILGLTVILETATAGRFDKVGNYASLLRSQGQLPSDSGA
jgi:hypothetical protein